MVAPGVSPGTSCDDNNKPRKGRKKSFAPFGAAFYSLGNPGLTPGATIVSLASRAGNLPLKGADLHKGTDA